MAQVTVRRPSNIGGDEGSPDCGETQPKKKKKKPTTTKNGNRHGMQSDDSVGAAASPRPAPTRSSRSQAAKAADSRTASRSQAAGEAAPAPASEQLASRKKRVSKPNSSAAEHSPEPSVATKRPKRLAKQVMKDTHPEGQQARIKWSEDEVNELIRLVEVHGAGGTHSKL